MKPTIPLAFVAGILSFLSPCVLPLIPVYLSYITGLSVTQLQASGNVGRSRRMLVSLTLAFVAGFAVVFVLLGASATLVGSALKRSMPALRVAGGIVMVILGLHLTGLLRLRFLDVEHRTLQQTARRTGRGSFIGAFLMGIAFSLGWSPCIGPILGGILLLAATRDTLSQGIALLAAYTAGLAVPFMLTALLIGRISTSSRTTRRVARIAELAGGTILVVAGILMVTGTITVLSAWANRLLPWLDFGL
jgi:cytochrome c-type biogenesis protein